MMQDDSEYTLLDCILSRSLTKGFNNKYYIDFNKLNKRDQKRLKTLIKLGYLDHFCLHNKAYSINLANPYKSDESFKQRLLNRIKNIIKVR